MSKSLSRLALYSVLPIVVLQAEQKPNVLYIMTDQQSFNMMSCMGNKWLSTPNMDRLAKQGYRFDKNYCANPVSQPSRFSLITGRFASDVNTRGNNDNYDVPKVQQIAAESSIGNLFKNAGYDTYYSGKTHLYSEDIPMYGFTLDGKSPYDEPAIYAEKFFPTRTQSSKPFFLVVSFMNPHDISYDAGFDPRYPSGLSSSASAATTKYLNYKNSLTDDQYKAQIPPVPSNLTKIDALQATVSTSGSGYRNWTDEQWDEYRWMYYRLTEEVDGQIGRVLAALDAAGLTDNTIIVFTSDHGEHNESHSLVHKTYMLEEAQRTPLIFSGKGIKTDMSNDTALVCNGLDIVPTMCDLAGISIPTSLSGISLKSYLTDDSNIHPTRDYLITESSPGFQITDGRYKYTIMEYLGNPDMLFDTKLDAGETVNLTYNPNFATIKDNLKTRLIADLAARGIKIGVADKNLMADDFEYVLDRPLILNPVASSATVDNVTGWSTQNTTSSNVNCFKIAGPSLTYSGYNVLGTGNALKYMGLSGQAVFKSFTQSVADDMDVYISFLINFSNLTTSGSDYFIGLKNSKSATAVVFGGRIYAKVNPANTNKEVLIGINKGSGGTTVWQAADAAIAANKTHLFVMKYHVGVLVGSVPADEVGNSDETMSLYIDPSTTGDEPTIPSLIHFDPNQADIYRYSTTGSVIGGVYGLYLRSSAAGVAPAYTIDDIRVGLNWADDVYDKATSTTGLKESEEFDFLYAINNKHILLTLPDNSFNRYEIVDITGKKLKNGILQSTREDIDITLFKQGVYILNLIGIQRSAVKIVVN